MIISHKHKFIFLHCRKTAGSSLTISLNRYLGPDDIQTSAWEETIANHGQLNRNSYKVLMWQAHKRPGGTVLFLANRIMKKSHNGDFMRKMIKKHYNRHLKPKSDHAVAESIRDFEPNAWDQYFKFCFVRNPFDHAVSDFFWKGCPQKGVTFEEFLLRKADPDRPDPQRVVEQPVTNWPIYTINNSIAVDFIGRYEYLHADVRIIEDTLKVGNLTMPKVRAKSKSRIYNGLNFYNSRTISLVKDIYRKEIEYFGYSFGDFISAHNLK